MIALVVVLGYVAIGVVSARWIYGRKAREYYHRFQFKPKRCFQLGQHWTFHDPGCKCKYEKSAERAKEKALGWLWMGVAWFAIPVVLYFSTPLKFEREIEAQKKKDEELAELKKIAEKEGWEL